MSRTARTAAPFLAAFSAVAGLGAADGGYFPSDWGLATLGFVLVAAPSSSSRTRAVRRGTSSRSSAGSPLLALWAALSCALVARSRSAGARGGARHPLRRRPRRLPCCSCPRARPPRRSSAVSWRARSPCRSTRSATRLFPGHVGGAYDPSSGYQLAEPIGYWNALGLLTARCDPARARLRRALRPRRDRRRSRAWQSSCSSRRSTSRSAGARWSRSRAGPWCRAALDPRRARLLVSGTVLGAPAALGVLEASRSHALTAAGATLQTAQAEGRQLARRLVALALLAAVARGRPASRRAPAAACRAGQAPLCSSPSLRSR